MPLLQVRDFPADIYELIKAKARQEHRTVSQQTIVLIKGGLGKEISAKKRRLQILQKIRETDITKEEKNFDFVKSIREDRKR